jgi:hypothetical protein
LSTRCLHIINYDNKFRKYLTSCYFFTKEFKKGHGPDQDFYSKFLTKKGADGVSFYETNLGYGRLIAKRANDLLTQRTKLKPKNAIKYQEASFLFVDPKNFVNHIFLDENPDNILFHYASA